MCATLWQPCVWRDFWSDKTFAFGPIATCSDSFCRRCTSQLHLHKWKHSYTNSMFSIFLSHSHSSFAFALRTSGILALGHIMTKLETWYFRVLPHWEIRPLISWPHIPLSHIILTLCEYCLILLILSASLGSDKHQWGCENVVAPPCKCTIVWAYIFTFIAVIYKFII